MKEFLLNNCDWNNSYIICMNFFNYLNNIYLCTLDIQDQEGFHKISLCSHLLETIDSRIKLLKLIMVDSSRNKGVENWRSN